MGKIMNSFSRFLARALRAGRSERTPRRPFVIMFMVVLAGACTVDRRGPIAYDVPNFGVPDAPRPVSFAESYRIATGDTLNITVFQVDALSKPYKVDLAGNLAFPLIGEVPAVGKTTAELRHDIATRLGQRYLRNPDVTVAVTESVNNKVTVEGGVRQPGVFPVTGPMTLVQSVAMARGIDRRGGNERRVAIFRTIGGQRMAAAFDLVSIRRGEMKDPEVFAGDIIVVESNTRRGIFQDILSTLPLLAFFRPF